MASKHAPRLIDLSIDKIVVGPRFRKDAGDVKSLAEAIQRIGFMDPIVVNEKHHLVHGWRRLLAAKLLQYEKVECKVVDLDDVLLGEWLTDKEHLAYTESEKAAIGIAVEERQGERRGRPSQNGAEIPDNCPELTKGTETRETAAELAGFDSYKTYERAKKVVTNGTPELIEAMDKKEVSISDAAAVAGLPAPAQNAAVKKVRKKKAKTLREAAGIKKPASDFEPNLEQAEHDDADQTIDDQIKQKNGEIESFCRRLMKFAEDNFPKDAWLDDMGRGQGAMRKIQDACSGLRAAKCHCACPMCKGEGCKQCHKTGRVPKHTFEMMV